MKEQVHYTCINSLHCITSNCYSVHLTMSYTVILIMIKILTHVLIRNKSFLVNESMRGKGSNYLQITGTQFCIESQCALYFLKEYEIYLI